MKLVVVFIVTFYCLYHHVTCNQQNPDDPSKPFWATRGRRSGRLAIKAEDYIPEKWTEEEVYPASETTIDKDNLLHKKEQVTSLLQNLLSALSSWDNEVIKKRGDSKTADPNNPFWAARG